MADALEAASEKDEVYETTDTKTFLESWSPGKTANITDYAVIKGNGIFLVNAPPLVLYCISEECKGDHYFDAVVKEDEEPLAHSTDTAAFFLTYLCRHCRRNIKFFGLLGARDDGRKLSGYLIKVGEHPAFGSPIPSRLLRLFGSDSEIFLKGRQCENQGLGVGAFSYYRRVVENHKDQLIKEIAKVAKRSGADNATMTLFDNAINEISFEKAIDSIKSAMPKELMLHGHNPLLLLHGALSQGLHDSTDHECLEAAHDVRVVLTELTEKISLLLKEEQELKQAVSRLLQKRQNTAPKQLTES